MTKGGAGMEHEERKKRDEELDRFWNIDALIPKKTVAYRPSDTETAEIVLEPRSAEETRLATEAIPPQSTQPKRHFIPPHSADEASRRPSPELEYTPDNALVRRVRLYRWKSDYRYYEGFVRDAEKLYRVAGAECPRVPFFSYVPQYTQMTRSQLEWYLWWRSCVRKGRFIDTDYSYVLLYAFELINLSDKIDPMRVRDGLCSLWIQYRRTFYQLDSYLPEWICDVCLIHRLPPPESCTDELLPAVMAHCSLKEFYVPSGGKTGYIQALLAFCSNYNYRKSKFYTEENAKLFDTAIMGAVALVSERMSEEGKLFSAAGMDDSHLARDAYTGALCSYRIKRRIEVEFCSFSRSHELRFFITDVVKYTENRIRAALSIRSRLTIYALPTAVRELLDGYLDGILPKRQPSLQKQREEEAREYEKLYDLPRKELSLHDAAEIERLSWDITERLVEAFEEEADEVDEKISSSVCLPVPTAPTVTEREADGGEESEELVGAMHPYLPLLRAVYTDDAVGQKQVARERGVPLDVLADEVNALAADLTGDILLKECDGVYAVIEDYRELLEALLQGREHEYGSE